MAATPAHSADVRLAEALATDLGPWFQAEQRPLTWRRTRDPYAIWVAEVMLQQTRVETVERYYSDFLARFPSVDALAAVDEDAVLEAWSGLGYYRRARLLHRGARYVRDELGGVVPAEPAALRGVPGIGPYTAGAIASIAFDKPNPLVDGNVARVLSRICGIEDPAQQDARAKGHWQLTEAILQRGRPRVLAQALMELGATVCVPRAPRCSACPVRAHCTAFERGATDCIPAPRKRAVQPVERLDALAVVVRNKLLLVQRPEQGLLANLWCLPVVPAGDRGLEGADAVLSRPDDVAQWKEAGSLRHVFTHRIWEVTVWVGQARRRPGLVDRAPTSWIARGERPSGGLPSVTAKLIRLTDFGTSPTLGT